jgi:hypothetical protein
MNCRHSQQNLYLSRCRVAAHLSAEMVPRRELPSGRRPRGSLPAVGDRALEQRRLGGRARGIPGRGLLEPRQSVCAAGFRGGAGLDGPALSGGDPGPGCPAPPGRPARIWLPEKRRRSCPSPIHKLNPYASILLSNLIAERISSLS